MTKPVHLLLLAAASVILTACANRPESIHASFVSHEKFMDLDCTALSTTLGDTRAELDKYSKLQDSKANSDAVGVFFLGVPFSKLSGDHEADVARLKGEVEAIETAQIKRKCKGQGVTAMAPVAAPGASVAEVERQTALLNDLRAKGLLTEQEYQARRGQILEAALTGAGQPTASPTSPPTAAPVATSSPSAGLAIGDRLVYEEMDPYTGVRTGEAILTLDDMAADRLSFNGGTIVLRRDGTPTKSQVASAFIYGFKPEGRDTLARFRVPNIGSDVGVNLAYAGTESRRIANRDFSVIRYRVTGHASHELRPGSGQAGKGGAPISGDLIVDAASGLVIQHQTKSAHAHYDVDRRLVNIVR